MKGKDLYVGAVNRTEFGSSKNSNNYEQPALALDPHVAPLGMMFYSGQQFPERFRNQILIPEHGSWNRSKAADVWL